MGSLMTHELNMAQKKEEEVLRKMKTIAFKSIAQHEESDESEEEEEDEEESEENDEDMELHTSKFKKFLLKRNMKKKEEKERKSVPCYNCNKKRLQVG